MSAPRNGEDLLETARRQLFTAVVGDVMDKMGLLHQFLPPRIRPIKDNTIVVGRAMTVSKPTSSPKSQAPTRAAPCPNRSDLCSGPSTT